MFKLPGRSAQAALRAVRRLVHRRAGRGLFSGACSRSPSASSRRRSTASALSRRTWSSTCAAAFLRGRFPATTRPPSPCASRPGSRRGIPSRFHASRRSALNSRTGVRSTRKACPSAAEPSCAHSTPATPSRSVGGRSSAREASTHVSSCRLRLPFGLHFRLLAFNGKTHQGHTAIWVLAYSPNPPVSFVLPFHVHRQAGPLPHCARQRRPARRRALAAFRSLQHGRRPPVSLPWSHAQLPPRVLSAAPAVHVGTSIARPRNLQHRGRPRSERRNRPHLPR